LDFAYEEAMQRIQGQDAGFQELALRTLLWVTCAKRPLSSRELQHALAVEPGDTKLGEDNLHDIEEVVSLCAGLVTIDEESDIIRLVHYTTQEYFQRTQRLWFPDAETEVTITCLSFLLFDEFSSGWPYTEYDDDLSFEYPSSTEDYDEAGLQEIALYKYAAHNWGHHARQASKVVESLIVDFLESGEKLSACVKVLMSSHDSHYYDPYLDKKMTGVHVAAYFGLEEVIKALLRNGHELESRDNNGRTPLSWAAENGYDTVVTLLLEKGAELELRDEDGRTPLSWAASYGNDTFVTLLLEKGAELESRDNNARTPLSWAARNGHDIVVTLLLEKGVSVNSKNAGVGTPLIYAAGSGGEAVVKLLLADSRIDVDSKDREGNTAPAMAACDGDEAVVKLLLDAGAERKTENRDGETPLSWATKEGHEAIVKLLQS
jgi:ankyrin repeat protein